MYSVEQTRPNLILRDTIECDYVSTLKFRLCLWIGLVQRRIARDSPHFGGISMTKYYESDVRANV